MNEIAKYLGEDQMILKIRKAGYPKRLNYERLTDAGINSVESLLAEYELVLQKTSKLSSNLRSLVTHYATRVKSKMEEELKVAKEVVEEIKKSKTKN